jgi:hypothetical protein
MIAIEINKGFLDLLPGINDEFYITRQINDIFNLNTRNADYTKIFKVPNSPGNRDKLGIQSDETKPADRLKCSLFIDDLSFSINSELLINKIDEYYIEVTILINGSIFFTLIPDASIKDLDLVDYNFTWDLTGVAAINTETEGAIFGKSIFYDMPAAREQAIIGGTPGTAFDVYADLWVYGFSFYVKTLIEKIITNAGFSLDDSLVTDIDNYADAVLMCSMLGLNDQNLLDTIIALVDMESPPQTVTGTTAVVDFVAITDPGSLWNNTTNKYDIGTTSAYNIALNYDISVTINPLLVDSGIELRIKNDTTVLHTLKITVSGDYSGTININEILASGTTLYVEVFAASTVGADNEVILNSGCDLSISSGQPLFSRDLKVANHLPEITQKSLLTNFLALSNIVLDIDDPAKQVVLRPFDSIFYKTPNDLTLNYDKSRAKEFSYIPENYYKNSLISYNNYSALQRTDLVFGIAIDNENLQLEGTILSFGLEGSDKERLYTKDLTYTPAYRGTLSNETGLSGTSGLAAFTLAAAVDFAPGDFIDVGTDTMRIATKTSATAGTIAGTWNSNYSNAAWDLIKFSSVITGPRIGIVDQATSTTLSTSDGDLTTGSAISCRDTYFHANLEPESIYDDYYKNLLDCFNKFIRLTCWLVLDAITFKNLDLTKPVYIQEFASSYYINKLEQWRPNGLVRAELLRINKEN